MYRCMVRATAAIALAVVFTAMVVACISCGKKTGPAPDGPGGIKVSPAQRPAQAPANALMGKGDPNAARPPGKGGMDGKGTPPSNINKMGDGKRKTM